MQSYELPLGLSNETGAAQTREPRTRNHYDPGPEEDVAIRYGSSEAALQKPMALNQSDQLRSFINTSDPRLFGNEAAEDEDPRRLDAYFVQKDEFAAFEDPSVKLSFVRARKGIGKSALLARVFHTQLQNPGNLVVFLTGSDLAGQRPFVATSPADLINDWQQRICFAINVRIGQTIGVAWADDSISLVETSELAGFRSRNLVGSLLDRLKGKLGKLELQKISSANARELLTRFQAQRAESTVWVFVDDIDATFRNTEEDRLRVSTFFSACRLLANAVSDVRIRASVRADVWSSIRTSDEALDKVEQYIVDPKWSRRETAAILAQRIRAYICDLGQNDPPNQPNRERLVSLGIIRPGDGLRASRDVLANTSNEEVIRIVFPGRFAWANDAHHLIHVFSSGRPRWAMQLCKMAAAEGRRIGNTREIKFGFIRQVLEMYGRARIADLAREHQHQCPQIRDLIQTFGGQSVRYSTLELLDFVQRSILGRMNVEIDNLRVSSAMQLAHFLYRVDFLVAWDRKAKTLIYYRYDDNPNLLRSVTNPDQGLAWEIAPSYRQVLNLTGDGSNLDEQ